MKSTRQKPHAQSAITFRERLTIADHELTVAAIVVANIIDTNSATEDDFRRLTVGLQRLRALAGAA